MAMLQAETDMGRRGASSMMHGAEVTSYHKSQTLTYLMND
jgi:hypothetical protein